MPVLRRNRNDCSVRLTHSRRARNVRFTSNSVRTLATQRNDATCQKATYAVQQRKPLLDHLVGAGEQGR